MAVYLLLILFDLYRVQTVNVSPQLILAFDTHVVLKKAIDVIDAEKSKRITGVIA